MLDIRVRVVLNKIVISFWCGSHGGQPHCLWSTATVKDHVGPDELATAVADCLREFARRVERLELADISDECLV
jgi:hypothetical protein